MTTGEQGQPRAPLLSAAGLVAGNLLPLWAVWQDWMSVGDVFITYWLENVAYWAITIVKVATARGELGPAGASFRLNGRPYEPSRSGSLAFFFAFHYGIFTAVHGVFAFVMAFASGGELNPGTWLLCGLALALSHLASLVVNWFGEGERLRVSAPAAMLIPYPRMLVLHVAILGGFGLVVDSVGAEAAPQGVAQLAPVLLLLGLKTAVDLALHLWERRRAFAADPAPVA